MKVSVVIPTHNRPLELKRAVLSVCRQTLKPHELIVVDDGSAEDVCSDLRGLVPEDINLICHRHDKPYGACAARNRGARLASGDILMFLDDDDTWEPTKVADQLRIFQQYRDVGLVYTGRLVVPESNRKQVLYKVKPVAAGYIFPEILSRNLIGITSSVAVRRDLFWAVGGFDECFPARQDYDLWIRCCKQTRVMHDGKYNVRFTTNRNKGDRITGQVDKHIKANLMILEKYKSDIEERSFIQTRQIKASIYFQIAKAVQIKNYWRSIPWMLRSFLCYPNIRAVALILPLKWSKWLRTRYYKYFKGVRH